MLTSHQFWQDKLDDPAFKVLVDYQAATVALLALMSGATDNVSVSFFLSFPGKTLLTK